MSDGIITITNVGVFGIDTGTPILMPGESAILAFGVDPRAAVGPQGQDQEALGHPARAVSFDHRLVDGELGSRVLADVAKLLEDPAQAMVWT